MGPSLTFNTTGTKDFFPTPLYLTNSNLQTNEYYIYISLHWWGWNSTVSSYIVRPSHALISQKPMFYQSKKHRKSVFYCFSSHYLYIIRQMKKPKPCITVIKHSRNVESTCLRFMFSTFPSCCKMPMVFYHSVVHG